MINYYVEIEISNQSSNAGEVKLHVVMKLHAITSKHGKYKLNAENNTRKYVRICKDA